VSPSWPALPALWAFPAAQVDAAGCPPVTVVLRDTSIAIEGVRSCDTLDFPCAGLQAPPPLLPQLLADVVAKRRLEQLGARAAARTLRARCPALPRLVALVSSWLHQLLSGLKAAAWSAGIPTCRTDESRAAAREPAVRAPRNRRGQVAHGRRHVHLAAAGGAGGGLKIEAVATTEGGMQWRAQRTAGGGTAEQETAEQEVDLAALLGVGMFAKCEALVDSLPAA